MRSTLTKALDRTINRVILIIGVAYFLIEYAWKLPFVVGGIGGIYWLFVIADGTALPLAGLFFGMSIVLLVVYIVMRIIRRGNHSAVGRISLASFLCALLLASTVFVIFAQRTVHLDAKRIRGRVYYLAVYPMFDDNYGLYECDVLGIFCHQVYRSGDYMAGFYAKLDYNQMRNELSIDVSGEGEIYKYELP